MFNNDTVTVDIHFEALTFCFVLGHAHCMKMSRMYKCYLGLGNVVCANVRDNIYSAGEDCST